MHSKNLPTRDDKAILRDILKERDLDGTDARTLPHPDDITFGRSDKIRGPDTDTLMAAQKRKTARLGQLVSGVAAQKLDEAEIRFLRWTREKYLFTGGIYVRRLKSGAGRGRGVVREVGMLTMSWEGAGARGRERT